MKVVGEQVQGGKEMIDAADVLNQARRGKILKDKEQTCVSITVPLLSAN